MGSQNTMDAESIKKSFSGLLDALASNGCIDEESKARFYEEFCSKVDGTGAEVDGAYVKAVVEEAAKKLKDEIGADGEEGPEAPAPGSMSVADAFKGFLSSIPQENLEAYNDLVASFSDEQKALGRKVIGGDVSDAEGEGQDGDGGEVAAAVEELAEKDEVIKEACEVISAMAAMFSEAGLGGVGDGILNEASGRLKSLTKEYERQYERFLKNSIKQMAQQNRKAKLTGGVVGAASRENDYGKVLKELRKKLYLSESSLEEKGREVLEARTEAGSLRKRLDEAEAARRSSEEASARLDEKVREANGERDSLKERVRKLEEAVDAASRRASTSEAKAFLTESVSNMSEDLRAHLLEKFSDSSVDEIRSGLNEAVEAYRSSRRHERMMLRNDDSNRMSRRVNEAVELDVDDKEDDQIVAGFVRMTDSLSRKL